MTGPKRFRKRPVEVEAMQYTGANTEELMNFIGRKCKFATHPEPVVVIATLEGDMTAKFDDYIIKGVKGEFYACKPDIFEATYEPVEDGGDV